MSPRTVDNCLSSFVLAVVLGTVIGGYLCAYDTGYHQGFGFGVQHVVLPDQPLAWVEDPGVTSASAAVVEALTR